MTDLSVYIEHLTKEARQASFAMSIASSEAKSFALNAIAARLDASRDQLKSANAKDLERSSDAGLEQALIDRLKLDDIAIDQMVEGIAQVDRLADPIGEITDLSFRPSGIQVGRMRVPLGTIGIIYESRPNVTADAAALCIKSGNSCILRGGSEAIESNREISKAITGALKETDLPNTAVQLVDTVDREAVGQLLKADEDIDIIIPRGGKGLIERITRESSIPVIKHLDGVCHVYIDESAEIKMAIEIALNSKASKYAVCNAAETLLVDSCMASDVLPMLGQEYKKIGVEIRGCKQVAELISDITLAIDEDWHEEYLGPVIAIKVVDGLAEAIEHINAYGSHHTDTIVTNNYENSRQFLKAVDSATVMVNASTQFADGFEFGLGAEIGISTDKLHARGPVGLEGLTTQKYVVFGHGEVRHR
ncbi:MAG: glutamate-5-semialdehyde dehydrogenase [Gammaproteobacteria bacterium]|nr:glutamate-5-semialdehyde dehydrogenase [Gammaproteobacteria bacterium]